MCAHICLTVYRDADRLMYSSMHMQVQQHVSNLKLGVANAQAAPSPLVIAEGSTLELLTLCTRLRLSAAEYERRILTHPTLEGSYVVPGFCSDMQQVRRLLAYVASSCSPRVASADALVQVKPGDKVIVTYSGSKNGTVYTGTVVEVRRALVPIVGNRHVLQSHRRIKRPTVDPAYEYRIRFDGWDRDSDEWRGAPDVHAASAPTVAAREPVPESSVCPCSASAAHILCPAMAGISSLYEALSTPLVCLTMRDPGRALKLQEMIAFCRVVQEHYDMTTRVAFLVEPCVTHAETAGSPDLPAESASQLNASLVAQASADVVFQFLPVSLGGWMFLTASSASGITIGDAQRRTSDCRRLCRDLQLHMLHAQQAKADLPLCGTAIPATANIFGWYDDLPEAGNVSDTGLRILLLVLLIIDGMCPTSKLANKAALISCVRGTWPASVSVEIRYYIMHCILCGFLPPC
jgi:hypothetical protein